jgi:hypothetical protein
MPDQKSHYLARLPLDGLRLFFSGSSQAEKDKLSGLLSQFYFRYAQPSEKTEIHWPHCHL